MDPKKEHQNPYLGYVLLSFWSLKTSSHHCRKFMLLAVESESVVATVGPPLDMETDANIFYPKFFIYALVIGPKSPEAEIPCAFWNLMSAARVAYPNSVVSFPGEPTPV